jgi:hypothetical protein
MVNREGKVDVVGGATSQGCSLPSEEVITGNVTHEGPVAEQQQCIIANVCMTCNCGFEQ